MKFLELKLHPPVVLCITLLSTYLCNRYFSVALIPEAFQDSYVYVATVGVFIAITGVWQFRQAKTTLDPHKPHNTNHLVSTGIYGFTRNPMYLGMALVLLAAILKLGDLLGLVNLPIFVLYLTYFQVKPEERAIEKRFGEEYNRYKSKVRRWL
ncbi:MAG: isoprenylcysteine carboxylmethyltransferase family protein [Paraglaciecola sp.]|uniref:methyltransferase family protein n=1 Tax=Paraglaciecola sp. TaxID=1920173 RepID=UPI003267B0F5